MDYYDDDLEQSLDDVNGLSEGLKEPPRKAANQLKKRAVRGARKAVSNGTKKAAKAVSNGTKKAAKAMGKMAASAVKAGIRAIGGAVKSIIHFLVATPPGWICDIILLLFLIIVGGIYVFQYEERGSNESNNLDPDVQNPAYMDTLTGITRAVAMTEPQAVIDAYYKYMSTSSYVKVSGAETFHFQNPEQTQDFAGLRDYNKIEENFYLSDDFVRMVDEILHQEDFFYPEQIIKPVFGAKMTLKDSAGNEGEFYTARLPVDTADGSIMLDEERVKNFSDMLVDATALASPSATGDSPQLIAQSQVPQAIEGDEGYFSLEERNIVEGDGITSTQPGLWDYGFASVLQYQPAQKISYIECSYDSADVDFDYKVYDADSGDWLGPYHGGVYSIPITGTLFDFYTACSAKCAELQGESETISYSYKAPTNIAAIVNDTTAWVTSVEGNAAEEASYSSFYGRTVTNSHIDAKIVDAWDKDIDNLEFASSALESSYGNVGGGLYPLNIAIVSHAATFSGNIHYSVIPAGEDGCIKSSVSLSYNSQADSDMRLPVQNIRVAGGCESATLTAHRTGNLITMLPKVQETTSPWGFEYHIFLAKLDGQTYRSSATLNDSAFDCLMEALHWRMPYNLRAFHCSDPKWAAENPVLKTAPALTEPIDRILASTPLQTMRLKDKRRQQTLNVRNKCGDYVVADTEDGYGIKNTRGER